MRRPWGRLVDGPARAVKLAGAGHGRDAHIVEERLRHIGPTPRIVRALQNPVSSILGNGRGDLDPGNTSGSTRFRFRFLPVLI